MKPTDLFSDLQSKVSEALRTPPGTSRKTCAA